MHIAWLRGHDGGTETGVRGRESSVRHIQEHGEGDGRYGAREKLKSKTHVGWRALEGLDGLPECPLIRQGVFRQNLKSHSLYLMEQQKYN